MAQLWSNAARTELAEAITGSGTTLVLKEPGGFPTISGSDWFKVVLQDSAGIEIVHVTAYDGGTQMTVVRARGGTTARAFAAGTVVGLRLVAGDLEALQTALDGKVSSGSVTHSRNDTTAGRLMKVGDFGVGEAPSTLVSGDYNTFPELYPGNGFVGLISSAATNAPEPGGYFHYLEQRVFGGQVLQLAYPYRVNDDKFFAFRSRFSGVWTPWRQVYHQGTVLGAVSQSGGVPTGAIIERGSNANGEYVKFADGTMICTAYLSCGATAAAGGLYASTIATWTYPASFVDAPSVAYSTGTALGWGAVVAADNTSANVRRWTNAVHSATNVAGYAVAIGRWF